MAVKKAEVLYVGDAKSIVRAAQQAGNANKKFAKETEGAHARVGRSFAGMASRAVKAGVAVGAAYASIAGAKAAVNTTEDLAKVTLSLHKNLGLSVHSASQWAAVAKSRGIDGKALNQSFGTLAKNAVAAAQGQDKQKTSIVGLIKEQNKLTKTGASRAQVEAAGAKITAAASKSAGPQADAFKKLGLSVKDVHSANTDFNGFMSKVSDGLNKMGPGAERNSVAMKLFGKGWQTVVPVLRGGSKAMDEQLKLADKYGVTFKGKTVKSLEDLIAAQRESKMATLGLQVAFGTQLAPALTKGTTAFASFVSNIRNGGGDFAKFRELVKAAVGEVRTDFSALASVAVPAFAKLSEVFKSLPGPAKIATMAAAALGAVFLATGPVGLGIAALVAGAIVIKRNWGAISGVFDQVKASVTGWVNKNRADMEVVGKAFADVAKVVRVVFTTAFDFAEAVVKRALPGIKKVIAGDVAIIKGVINVFLGVLHGDWSRVWGGLKGIVSGAIKSTLGALRAMTAPTREVASRIGSAIVGVFHDLGSRFFQLGQNLIQGLVGGIKSAAQSAVDAAKGVAKGAVDGVKNFLGISSPSKVFHKIGVNVAEGFVLGLLSHKEAVADGLNRGLLFPIDAAIAALNAKKDRLQAVWDAIDKRAERSSLVRGVRSARTALATPVSSGSSSGSSGGGTAGGGSGVIGGGKFLQGLGLQVGESKYFGGVTTTAHKHYKNDHYSGNSIDVNAAGGGAAELSKLQAALTALRSKFSASIQQAFIEDANTANQHLHVTFKSAGSAAKAAATKVAKTMGAAGKGSALNRSYPGHALGAKGAATLSVDQVRAVAEMAGFSPGRAMQMAQVAHGESGYQPGVISKDGGFGLFQNTPRVWGASAKAYLAKLGGKKALLNPLKNAKMAKFLSDAAVKAGKDPFSPWFGTKFLNRGMDVSNVKSVLGKSGLGGSGTKGSKSAVSDAIKALKDFDKEAARAKKLAAIDVQVKNLERLKAFKDAIAGIRTQVKDLAGQAAQAWRAIQEKRIDAEHDAALAYIDNSAPALELRSLQETDAAEQDKKTKEGLDQDYADAKLALSTGTTKAEKDDAEKKIKDAEDALEGYKRGKREAELAAWVENEKTKADKSQEKQKDGLDQQTADYQTALEAQLGVLTDNLEKRKTSYTQWAKEVNGILAGYGLSVATDSGTEATVQGGPGPGGIDLSKWVQTTWKVSGGEMVRYGDGHVEFKPNGSNPIHATGSKPQGKAGGGWVYPGMTYTVGEVGREQFTPAVGGRITPASRSGGGGSPTVVIDKAYIGSQRAAEVLAHKLAHRMRFG
jgi:hypothetical protein